MSEEYTEPPGALPYVGGPSEEQLAEEAELEDISVPPEFISAARGEQIIFESKVDYEFTGEAEKKKPTKAA